MPSAQGTDEKKDGAQREDAVSSAPTRGVYMFRKATIGAVLGFFAAACSAAPPEDARENVGAESAAIRDPEDSMCWYVECDDTGTPINPGGSGGGGPGGSGEGSGTVGGEGGGAGGGSGGGGPGGVYGPGGMADGADLLRCQTACDMQGPALTQFCASIPVPMVQALCFANEFTGIAACNGFCYAWFLAS